MSDRAPKLAAKHFGLDAPQTVTITDVGDNGPYVTSGKHEEYGPWYMYAVTLDGEKRAFFPSTGLHDQIMRCYEEQGFGVGAQLTICKHERADGGEGIWWAVGLAGTSAEPPGAKPQKAPKRDNRKIESSEGKIGGVERMALHALEVANKQLTSVAGPDFTPEDLRGWASTVLIAMQKAGVGPHDFPDITDAPDESVIPF